MEWGQYQLIICFAKIFKISVRFRMLTEKVGLLYVGGCEQPFGKLKYTKALKDLDNKIIECSVNPQGLWIFMRERTDKLLPNSYSTAKCIYFD